jgi:hypothetical protein
MTIKLTAAQAEAVAYIRKFGSFRPGDHANISTTTVRNLAAKHLVVITDDEWAVEGYARGWTATLDPRVKFAAPKPAPVKPVTCTECFCVHAAGQTDCD